MRKMERERKRRGRPWVLGKELCVYVVYVNIYVDSRVYGEGVEMEWDVEMEMLYYLGIVYICMICYQSGIRGEAICKYLCRRCAYGN